MAGSCARSDEGDRAPSPSRLAPGLSFAAVLISWFCLIHLLADLLRDHAAIMGPGSQQILPRRAFFLRRTRCLRRMLLLIDLLARLV